MRARVLAAMTVARELEAVYVMGAQAGGARRPGVPSRRFQPSARIIRAACHPKTPTSSILPGD
jgi:hypothetical protein